MLAEPGLQAVCRGEPLDRARHELDHEVKAITYHGLTVRPQCGPPGSAGLGSRSDCGHLRSRDMAGGGYHGPLEQVNECCWRIPKSYKEGMRVDGLIYADDR